MKRTITARTNPCKCGCQGRDPWHQRKYTRVISDVQETSGEVVVLGRNEPQPITATGKASFPWGTETVVKTRSGWMIKRDNP